jgi:hypothetical protein
VFGTFHCLNPPQLFSSVNNNVFEILQIGRANKTACPAGQDPTAGHKIPPALRTWKKNMEQKKERGEIGLSVLGPLVLTADLLLLLRSEVVRNIESLADLVGGLALDHVGDCLATDVQ